MESGKLRANRKLWLKEWDELQTSANFEKLKIAAQEVSAKLACAVAVRAHLGITRVTGLHSKSFYRFKNLWSA